MIIVNLLKQLHLMVFCFSCSNCVFIILLNNIRAVERLIFLIALIARLIILIAR